MSMTNLQRAIGNALLGIALISGMVGTAESRGRASLLDNATSLQDVTGQAIYEDPAVVAAPMALDAPPAALQALVTSTGLPQYLPPAGNVLLVARTTADGSSTCVTVGSPQTVFEETFTTAQATSYMEVDFSAQVALGSGTVSDGVYLLCSVTQGGVTVPCSATKEGPLLLKRVLDSTTNTNRYRGVLAMTAYKGYVRADPSTETTVKVQVGSLTGAANVGNICFPNLALRY